MKNTTTKSQLHRRKLMTTLLPQKKKRPPCAKSPRLSLWCRSRFVLSNSRSAHPTMAQRISFRTSSNFLCQRVYSLCSSKEQKLTEDRWKWSRRSSEGHTGDGRCFGDGPAGQLRASPSVCLLGLCPAYSWWMVS